MERRGVSEPTARNLVRTSPTLIAALAVRLGDADAMIAGAYGASAPISTMCAT